MGGRETAEASADGDGVGGGAAETSTEGDGWVVVRQQKDLEQLKHQMIGVRWVVVQQNGEE